MKEEKLAQLKVIFKNFIETIIFDVKSDYTDFNGEKEKDTYKNQIANKLVYEVKIRINNK